MLRKWLLFDLGIYVFLVLLASAICGCTVSGLVVDSARYETSLNKIRLDYPSTLCVYYAGSQRDISLKDVSTLEIDPSNSIVINNQLFYSAEITFKNENEVKSNSKFLTDQQSVFVSVHNSIMAINGKSKFRIGLNNITRLNIF